MFAAIALVATIPTVFRDWTIAFERGPDLWIARGDGKFARRLVKGGERPTWSPDRKQVAFVRDKRIVRVNRDGASERVLWTVAEDAEVLGLTWGAHPYVRRWHAEDSTPTGTSIIVTVREGRRSRLIQLRVDGDRIETSDVDPADGTGCDLSGYGPAAWSGDGATLAFTMNGDIWMARKSVEVRDPIAARGWDCSRVSPIAQYDSPSNRADRTGLWPVNLSLNRDASQLVFDFGENGHKRPDVMAQWRRTATSFSPPRTISSAKRSPCLSRDGKWILATDYTTDPETLVAISIGGRRTIPIITGKSGAW